MTPRRAREASRITLARGLLIVAASLAFPAQADEALPEIRAAASPLRPMVMEEGGHLTGFSIDLWNEVAAQLKVKTSYRLVPDAPAPLDALRKHEADVAVMGVFYTTDRDREFDFSYPILNTGQQVMVRSTADGGSDRPLMSFLEVLFSRAMAFWLFAALLLILVPAHVIWFLERREPEGPIPSEKYLPGIFHAMVWAAEAMVSQAQQMPRQRVARLLGILWLYVGIVFVAFLTANLTTNLTMAQIRGTIDGPEDLPGKEVGAPMGTASADYLRDIGATVRTFPQADEMYAALLSGQVDAVVAGAPILRYFASHEGLGKVRVVGPEFKRANVGFLVPLGSPLRKRISSALLVLQEDGSYQRIYRKWFGAD